MAYYVIIDSTANLVEAFDSEAEAKAALEQIALQDPDEADEYALIPYGEDGMPCGDAITAADIGVAA